MSKFKVGGSALRIIYQTLPHRRRRQVWLTLALMVLGAAAEVLSVGAILPFLSILVNPGQAVWIPLIGGWFGQLPQGNELVSFTAAVFVFCALASGALRLILTWVSQAFAFNASHDLSVEAFHRTISQPY